MKLLTFNIDNEQQLVEKCQNHDVEAQKKLFDLYSKKMMAICMRYVHDEEIAFDLLNDAFLKIFQKIKTFKPEISLESWMRRIVVNTVIDYLRKNHRYKKLFVRMEDFPEYGEPVEDDGDISDFWEVACELSIPELMKMLNELPTVSRMVFNLYAIDEYTHKQIAQMLGISESTSKWHLFNARRILRQKVEKWVYDKLSTNEKKFKRY
ncbi:MAG: RNA polymerase sigma factor [Bacteroidales bacterium]|nr:RNA polymerase sigma factor [Bacteroidales bacterium]